MSVKNTVIRLGDQPELVVSAQYGDNSELKQLTQDQYSVDRFDSNKLGEQTITVSYSENGVTRTAQVTVTVIDPDAVDYSKLNAAIGEAKKLQKADYTNSTWKVLQDALSNAESALSSKDQQTVDKATEELKNAIASLKKVAIVSQHPDGQDNSADSTAKTGVNTIAVFAVGAILAMLGAVLVWARYRGKAAD